MNKKRLTKYSIKKDLMLISRKVKTVREMIWFQAAFRKYDLENKLDKKIPMTSFCINKAFFDSVTIQIAKLLYDHQDNDLSIQKFVEKYNKNTQFFKQQKYIYVTNSEGHKERIYLNRTKLQNAFDKLQKLLNDNKKIIDDIKQSRNKIIAHNDILFSNNIKRKINLEEYTMDDIINLVENIDKEINNLINVMYGIIQYNNDVKVKKEIEFLNKIIKI